MSIHTFRSIIAAFFLGALLIHVNAQDEDLRVSRQSSEFDFPAPRRQTPATLPVFSSDGGRGRSRQVSSPLTDTFDGAEFVDEGFQEPQLPPPRQPSRGGGSRFSSRPQFTPDFGSEVDTGSKVKGQSLDGTLEESQKEAEVDRLALLLQDSKFSCTQKKPGYYADDGLRCEVFHYCNEGVRHSWMCPAGTLFHQIHLICMAEGGDNICKQSTKFHFVNDYLYKPLQESTQESNGTIRYANRYFPNEAGQVQDPSGGGQQLQQGGGLRQPIQDDFSDFQAPPQGQSFRPRPQSEESFFAPPPPRSSGGGARFRPTFEDDGAQFVEPPAEFSGGSRGGGSRSSHLSGEDLRAFGSDEAPSTRFQSQAPSRVRGRQGGRSQDFPVFSRS